MCVQVQPNELRSNTVSNLKTYSNAVYLFVESYITMPIHGVLE